ncbi:MAG: putative O-glycosylation ligase, exosortase A system-associated [Burkholderiales bacterium]|nr:putative O-glycosylation ligase, exosortase A system-associated [Burkholderiales bacterium]
MRDIALTAFVAGLLPFILLHPYVGALAWAWVSIMNPHRLTFSFAFNMPFAMIIAIVTLASFVLNYRKRHPFPWNPLTALLIAFVAWMTLTSVFALGPPEEVFEAWLQVFKIHLMLLVSLMLLKGRKQIEMLVWVIFISLGYYGVKGGLFTLVSGGGDKVWGPKGGVIEENNALAVALVVLLPLIYYLRSTVTRQWMKWGFVFAMIAVAFSILGSQSRGALLAVTAAATMLALKSKRPALMGMLGAITLAGIIAFMPDSWTNRMQTMETYEADGSAMGRLYAWETSWNLALDRPLVGGGFRMDNPLAYRLYAPKEFAMNIRTTPVAHSIYFQALGEHGFVGLGLFLALMFAAWRSAGRVIRECKGRPDLAWADLLMRMTQVSLIGYLSGGAFLNLLHFDVAYYLVGIVVLTGVAVREALAASPAPQPAAVQAAGAAGAPPRRVPAAPARGRGVGAS